MLSRLFWQTWIKVDEMAKKREKAPWGTYSMVFWKFYESEARKQREEFEDTDQATRAQRSMLCLMGRKGIHDVKVKRWRNVLYLERVEKNVRRNHSGD